MPNDRGVSGTPIADVLTGLRCDARGLSTAEAELRLHTYGANALRTHHVTWWGVLLRQLRNPLLLLLLAAAGVSGATGQPTDAVIIGAIVTLSVGLGFVNEFRSERAVAALHDQIRHRALVTRDGVAQRIDVVDLVPGDLVGITVGDIVPADLRLLEADELACDEAVLTGESAPAEKTAGDNAGADACVALMGTIVREGAGRGIVTETGSRTAFGQIALGLGERHPETAFQTGLRRFSFFLVRVAGALTVTIFVLNVALHRPTLTALLFSLAIAVGITPQLLPAIVTVSLSTGARQLAHKHVLVKRLVSIEDLGNMTLLFTDKTGTLTDGHITFMAALDAGGEPAEHAYALGLVCNEATLDDDDRPVGGNQLDVALWTAATPHAAAGARAWKRIAVQPFDHERRLATMLVDDAAGERWTIVKGEPEGVLQRCAAPPAAAPATLERLYQEGRRVIAIAARGASSETTRLTDADDTALTFVGFLVFVDRPKFDARASLTRLAELGVAVKVITGDSELVALTVCREIGIDVAGSLTGDAVDAMSDERLQHAIASTTLFARVGPETKARIVRLGRPKGGDVAFLGDGVNDALALHHADVGISVDTATEVAKDAADIILLDKDLGVLADGVVEGRRIFSNTIKYVLMATSSNFGNMFSAAASSAFLSFLPMLPGQILLNNLLYDTGQMTIPSDAVDHESLARPAAWDLHFIRRFMAFFGPISSAFDFATFAVLLLVLHAHAPEFRTGWFVESLATQTLVIFVIRTRRRPFWRSRPSRALIIATLAVPLVGVAIPLLPFGSDLGFTHLPAEYYAILTGFVIGYLGLAEVAKAAFYRAQRPGPPLAARRKHAERRVQRRAAPFRKSRPATAARRSARSQSRRTARVRPSATRGRDARAR